MIILKILWAVIKACLYLLESLFLAVERSGRRSTTMTDTALRSSYTAPVQDRNSTGYVGTGNRH